MIDWKRNTISDKSTIKEALARLNEIGIAFNVLFVVDSDNKLKGSITDGDIRRGLLNNSHINDSVEMIFNPNCKKISKDAIDNHLIRKYKNTGIKILPVVNDREQVVNVFNINDYKEIVPADAIIMAGGKGERLLPLTKDLPKPLLPVGGKPIIEHNIDRLINYGFQHIHISVNYLADKICDYFGDGDKKGVSIKYIRESKPLGTIGAASLVESYVHDTLLLMNSDLLTNIDFADLYSEFILSGADMAVATIPHHVDLPYAILELHDNTVASLKEKPRYTYFANAGIYLFKKELLQYLPYGEYFNATDLMEKVIAENKKLIHFPVLGYWLDIGRMNDYHKAQEDFKHILF